MQMSLERLRGASVIWALISTCGCSSHWRERCEKVSHDTDSPFSELVWGSGERIFDDATEALGFHHIHDLKDITSYYDSIVGGGVAMQDFDRDGDLDLVVTGGESDVGYFINEGPDGFVECAGPAGIARGSDWSVGVSSADFDNDGDRDLLLLNTRTNRLLRNLGDGSFEDITSESGLKDEGRSGAASWADIDHDGLLDLFVANLAEDFVMIPNPQLNGGRSSMYRNLGGGVFEDMTSRFPSGALPIGSSYITPLLDLDGDNEIDVLHAQEFGMLVQRNQVYRNQGPDLENGWVSWENLSETANLTLPKAVMGAAIFDLNGDSLPEVFLTNLWEGADSKESLHWNTGGFIFEDRAQAYNVNGLVHDPAQNLSRTSSWAALNLDYDNDADDDLYTVYGQHLEGEEMWRNCQYSFYACPNQPNALYRNNENANFTQLGGTGSEDQGMGRGAAAGDINADGCLDIVSVNTNSPTMLLLNKCNTANRSVLIELEGTVSNRDAVGSILTIEAGGKMQTKFITAGATSVHSSQPFGVHIGIGSASQIDALTIKWPTGEEEIFGNIEIQATGRTRYVIREGDGFLSPFVPIEPDPDSN